MSSTCVGPAPAVRKTVQAGEARAERSQERQERKAERKQARDDRKAGRESGADGAAIDGLYTEAAADQTGVVRTDLGVADPGSAPGQELGMWHYTINVGAEAGSAHASGHAAGPRHSR